MPGEVVPVTLHTISVFLKFSIFFRVISFYIVVSYASAALLFSWSAA
jgi:hypothetical protein